MKNLFLVFVLGMLLFNCSSVERSVGMGAIGGAAGGSLGGAYVGGKPYGKSFAKKGLVWGSLTGALTGYFIHQGLEKRDAKVRRETLLNLKKFDVINLPKE